MIEPNEIAYYVNPYVMDSYYTGFKVMAVLVLDKPDEVNFMRVLYQDQVVNVKGCLVYKTVNDAKSFIRDFQKIMGTAGSTE